MAHSTPASFPAGCAPGIRIERTGKFMVGTALCAFGIALACGGNMAGIDDGAHWGPFRLPLLIGVLIAAAGSLVVFRALLPPGHALPVSGQGAALCAIAGTDLVFAAALGGFSALGVPTLGLLCGIYIAGFGLWLMGVAVRAGALAAFALALAFGSHLAFAVAPDSALPLWPSFVFG